MKLLLTISVCLIAYTSLSQQTITSVNPGVATNPLNWDCLCIPQFNDNIIINHAITLDTDWVINGGGSVTVNAAGSLLQDAQNRTILIDDNNSSFTNAGETHLTNLVFLKNANGSNTSNLKITNGFYIDTLASFNNQGSLNEVDSTLSMGVFTNSGTFLNGSFWSGGEFNNSGYVEKDSLLNTGILNSSSGFIKAFDLATTGEFNLTGSSYMVIFNNFYNTGRLEVSSGRDLRISNDFFSGDSTFSTAFVNNNGLIEVGNDFLNIDTLQGDGLFCIGGESANAGRVLGTLDICSNTTTNLFNINTGQIDASVTNCNSGCSVDIAKNEMNHEITFFPNPFTHILNIASDDSTIESIELFNAYGQAVLSKENEEISSLDLSFVKSGVYFIKVVTSKGVSTHRLLKK